MTTPQTILTLPTGWLRAGPTLDVSVPGPFATLADVKRANADAGHHWFDPGAMRFFNSRVGSRVACGRFFVASSAEPSIGVERRYSLHVAMDDGTIETVGPPADESGCGSNRAFDSSRDAWRWLRDTLHAHGIEVQP